jgi:L-ascorbate metabolism protein UlaG (beta-lactamase superfamily)
MSDPAPSRERTNGTMAKAGAMARSGMKRYPRELLASVLRRGEFAVEKLSAQSPDWSSVAAAPLATAWVGHSTVLLRIGGKWVLTDPVFSHRIGVKLGPWTLGMGRLAPPHFEAEQLPQVDVVLLSHAHFDHLDKPSLRRLVNRNTMVVTAAHTAGLVPKGFGDVRELHWDQEALVAGLKFRAIKPAHWGARTAWDRHRGYNAYVIEGDKGIAAPGSTRLLYAGDTAKTTAFREVGGVDLSVFGIGAYDPWIHAHATPEQVWTMHEEAGGKYLLPVHHSTFKLSDEPLDEPLRRLVSAAGTSEDRVILAEPGEAWKTGETTAR